VIKLYTKEEAKKVIEFALSMGGKTATVIIDDSLWPFKTEMTLTKCDPWWDSGGNLRTNPRYNIDWDTRDTTTGTILAMGSFDFNDLEDGAEKLARQINESKAYLFMGGVAVSSPCSTER